MAKVKNTDMSQHWQGHGTTTTLIHCWWKCKMVHYFRSVIHKLVLKDHLVLEDPLEEGMATHSSILAWIIPWTEELHGWHEFTGLQRIRHDSSNLACMQRQFALDIIKNKISHHFWFVLPPSRAVKMLVNKAKIRNPQICYDSLHFSHSVVSNFMHPMDYSPPGSSVMGFLGKNTGVGCHLLLQGILPTQGSHPGFLHCRQSLYHLSHQGSLYFQIKTGK